MKKIIRFLLLLPMLVSVTFSQDTSLATIFTIGETEVSVVEECCYPCVSKVLFINLHDNEITSVKAAGQYLTKTGGRLINIENCGERFIAFRHKGNCFSFDPNRIYSAAGVETTLTLLSSVYNKSAAKQVSRFANFIRKKYIDNSTFITALHNNRDSFSSVKTYKKEQALHKGSGKVFINPEMDSDDFILTTDINLFKAIKQKNINVVWENIAAIADDGSLSIYAARHKIPYINIEAEHEHAQEQLCMLQALDDVIKVYTHKRTKRKYAAKK